MTWTWGRAHTAIGSLQLPSGQYAVGIGGRVLYAGGAETVDVVDLLVTPGLLEQLRSQGWQPTRNLLTLGTEDERQIATLIGGQLGGALGIDVGAEAEAAAEQAAQQPLPDDTLAHPSEPGLIATSSNANYSKSIATLLTLSEDVDGVPVLPARFTQPHIARALILARSTVKPTMTEPSSPYAVAAPDNEKAFRELYTDAHARLLKVYGPDGPPPATIPALGGIGVGVFLLLFPLAAALLALILWAVGGPWVPVAIFACCWLGLLLYMKLRSRMTASDTTSPRSR